jgi:hypothetical protein
METKYRHIIGCMLIACIVGLADAQTTTTIPQSGGGSVGINAIVEVIERNNLAVDENSKKIDSMSQIINEQYQKWLGTYLFGTGAFLLFIYGFIGVINSYMKKRGLKKTEQHIAEQNKKIQDQDKNLFRILNEYKIKQENTQKTLDEYVKNTEEINKILTLKLLDYEITDKKKKTIYLKGMTTGIVCVAILYSLTRLMGWF